MSVNIGENGTYVEDDEGVCVVTVKSVKSDVRISGGLSCFLFLEEIIFLKIFYITGVKRVVVRTNL